MQNPRHNLIISTNRNLVQRIFILLFSGLALSGLQSQTIYITSSDDLYRLDLLQCTYELVVEVDRQMSDITFMPDGTLIGISRGGELFEIDTITGQTTFLYEFTGALFDALTSTVGGLIYTVDRDGEFWSFERSTGIATYLGNIGYGYAGDLAFFNGELYMSSFFDDLIIKVDITNPYNSTIVMTDAAGDGGGMYGVVTYALDCNDIRFYGIVSGNFTILEVDLENLTIDTICILDRLFAGGATTREFKASDPIRLMDTLIVNPECGKDNGVITLITQGGIPPYEYSLNGGLFQDQNVFQNLSVGEYELIIVDTRGCSTEVEINLSLQDLQLIEAVVATDATCMESNGQIQILPTDIGVYQYSLDGINFQLTGFFDQLSAGSYHVIVQDEAGCEEQQDVEILEIPAVSIASMEVAATTCGGTNGTISLQTINGNNVAYSIDGNIFQMDPVFENLPSGNFIITVEDENGCRDDSLVSILPSMELSIDSIQIINPACGELVGSVFISISNSTGINHYSVDGQNAQLSPLFSSLSVGSHMWNVVDEVGCTATGVFAIELIPELELNSINRVSADCNVSNGEIDFDLLNVAGTIKVWLNGELFSSTHVTGLPAATYIVHMEDDHHCVIDTTLTLESKPCNFYIPNVFSPNGDGANDDFIISLHPGGGKKVRQFLIFDRWGTIVFSSENLPSSEFEIKWDGIVDGKPLNPGVFVYYLELEDENAEPSMFTGDITLIR